MRRATRLCLAAGFAVLTIQACEDDRLYKTDDPIPVVYGDGGAGMGAAAGTMGANDGGAGAAAGRGAAGTMGAAGTGAAGAGAAGTMGAAGGGGRGGAGGTMGAAGT